MYKSFTWSSASFAVSSSRVVSSSFATTASYASNANIAASSSVATNSTFAGSATYALQFGPLGKTGQGVPGTGIGVVNTGGTIDLATIGSTGGGGLVLPQSVTAVPVVGSCYISVTATLVKLHVYGGASLGWKTTVFGNYNP